MTRGEANCWLKFRRHAWKMRATRPMTVKDGDKTIGLETQILYVCERCGRPIVRTIDGNWSPENLTRVES